MNRISKTLVALMLTVWGGSLFAQAPAGYYDNATGKTGDELKAALHNIIKEHTTISYQQIWTAFWSTDNKGNNVVWDMYSDGATYTYSYTNGNQQCGEYTQEGDCYNREHSWPKSWFAGNEQTVPGRDLHHIFPTDGYVNAQRGNLPFGEVGSGTVTTFQNGSKLGNCKASLGYTGKVYEPIDEYKGDFARAYFYMSTRYYTEDSDWGTSGMTNKSEILPWAINMLLDWSDADPVSQKEIDRNNAVYGIQGNRNPFIDHPEYAHIIWEPDWTGVTYNITCASVQHGTITAPANAVEGTMVTLSATPSQGYMLGQWSVYKTGEPSTTVSVSDNGTFTMPSFNVTVSATFVQNNTQYSITCATGLAHGSISTNVSSATSGTTVTLSNTPANGYILYSYYVYKTGDLNTIVYSGSGSSFTMPAYNVTVSASFVQPSNYNYVKVTSAPADWSGDYVLVYENSATSAYVWTGIDDANCYAEKAITDNSIADDGMVSITIASMTGGYSIKVNGGSNNGKYIKGTSGSNALGFVANPALNTLSFESDGVKIISNTSVMRYNNSTNNNRFRYFKSDTYTNQQPIQLYKKTGTASAPTHTIQFNPNGASGTSYTQTVNEFEPIALQANAFNYEGYAFDHWNTEADGSGTSYFNGATVTLLNDLTLYAQWQQLYNVTLTAPGNGNSISASHSQAVEGDIVTLTATPATGYEFDCWNVTASGQAISVSDNSFEMPSNDVTVSATFTAVATFAQQYYKVTNVGQLVAGRTYLIVNTAAGQALSTTQNNNNRAGVGVSISNGVIASIGSTVCELTLGLGDQSSTWTFFDAKWNNNGGGYLYAASSSSNNLKTQTTNDANGEWSISIASDGTATIVAQGSNSRNQLRYNPNNGNPIFSCYGDNSTLAKVELYIRSEENNYSVNTTLACLNTFDKSIIQLGVTLTANKVLGTTMCNQPDNLVLEDGAQLVHHTDGVQATVKKTIEAYTDDGGWYTIATPFATYDPANALTTNNYDLYAYDESANSAEWRNYKAANFSLVGGKGYLYAHNPTVALRMTGILNNGDHSETVSLSYAGSQENLKGFNLLGNPTAHDISFTKTGNVADGYYYLSNSSTWEYTTATTVPAGRGFLVKANAVSQSVTLNPQQRGETPNEAPYLCIAVDNSKVYVKLSEGISMPLLSLKGRHAPLYLSREGQRYAMLVADQAPSLDLCYEAPQNGTCTLTAYTDGLDLAYLHLIDHLTGADVDLLTTPNYTFEANVSNYPNRFQLVFDADATNANSDDEAFAYYADGEIRLFAEDCPSASLQIIDATGRIIVQGNAINRISTSGMTPGIHILRLVTTDTVRVQRIVVQ